MNAIEHLAATAWKRPMYYGGFSPEGDYCILSRHRDSELLDRVNWDVACETLKAEAYDDGAAGFATRPVAYHWRAGCSLVGWIEYLCVRADAPESVLTEAGEIVCARADYPILDESRYSDTEFEAACNWWQQMTVKSRMCELKLAGLSIFAARRDYMPSDPQGALYQQLSEGL